MLGKHTNPGTLWQSILELRALRSGWVSEDHDNWYELPLRSPVPIDNRPPHNSHLWSSMGFYEDEFRNLHKVSCDRMMGWHQTALSHLPSILSESEGPHKGALRYGGGTHLGNHGVNFFTYFPEQNFAFHDQWCLLKLSLVPCATHLTGGSTGRYCINGPLGVVCRMAEIESIYVMRCILPHLVHLT